MSASTSLLTLAEIAAEAGARRSRVAAAVNLGLLQPRFWNGREALFHREQLLGAVMLLRSCEVDSDKRTKQLRSVREVASVLAIDPRRLQKWISRGVIKPDFQTKSRGTTRYYFLPENVFGIRKKLQSRPKRVPNTLLDDPLTMGQIASALGVPFRALQPLVREGVLSPAAGDARLGSYQIHFFGKSAIRDARDWFIANGRARELKPN